MPYYRSMEARTYRYDTEAEAQAAAERVNLPGFITLVRPDVTSRPSGQLDLPDIIDVHWVVVFVPDPKAGARLGDVVNGILHKSPVRHITHRLTPARDSSGCSGCFKRHGQLNRLDRKVRQALRLEES